MLLFLLLSILLSSSSFRILQHPLEKRISYVYGIGDITKLDVNIKQELRNLFQKYPLLIFKDVNDVSPKEFLNFIKEFDVERDDDALNNPQDNTHQMLQPFDQFPDCNHVAPRGNIELINYYDIKNIKIEPFDLFVNNYVWHTDILGHEFKLPNVVTGFYLIEQPLIGGDTDFISGETIYENLSKEEQLACNNILTEINRRKFVTRSLEIDYGGIQRSEEYEERLDGNCKIPIVFAPDNIHEKPRVLLMPTFFENVVGWNIKDSREWIKNFMCEKVLPHRVSIQWKKNDLAVFNNRRFMHSSTPTRNYMDCQFSPKRLLLQTFIPTNKPLLGIKPLDSNVYSCFNLKWIKDDAVSIKSAHDHIKYSIATSVKNNITAYDDKYYVLAKKPKKQ